MARMASTTEALNNTEIADLLGVNHSTISRLRSGERRPSRILLAHICKVYRLDEQQQARLATACMGSDKQAAKAFERLFTGRL